MAHYLLEIQEIDVRLIFVRNQFNSVQSALFIPKGKLNSMYFLILYFLMASQISF